jgi:PAS domain S-box-containing protein
MTLAEMRRETGLPVVMVNQQGFITYINDRFEAVFGWTRADLLGKGIDTIIPPSLHDAHHLGFSRFVTTGQPTLLNKPLKLRAKMRDGREVVSEHIIVAEKDGGAWSIGATLRPLPLDEA